MLIHDRTSLRTGLKCYFEWKILDYLCSCKSEISNVCKVVEVHCLQAMKIVHHYANDCFDRLISGQQSVHSWREAISILSGKYKRFMFVYPVGVAYVTVLLQDRQLEFSFHRRILHKQNYWLTNCCITSPWLQYKTYIFSPLWNNPQLPHKLTNQEGYDAICFLSYVTKGSYITSVYVHNE